METLLLSVQMVGWSSIHPHFSDGEIKAERVGEEDNSLLVCILGFGQTVPAILTWCRTITGYKKPVNIMI